MDDNFENLKKEIDGIDKENIIFSNDKWMLYQTAKVLIEKITHLENEIEELKRRQNVHR